jgi:Uma2 family endonuclease
MAVAKAHTPYAKTPVAALFSPEVSDKLLELIEGEMVHMSPAGAWHNRVASNIELLFRLFCRLRPDLDFGGRDDGFLIEKNPDTLLVPEACLFLTRPWPDSPWREFAPEIWVEVLSPGNSTAEMTFKRHRLFEAGTEQFWLVDPVERHVQIFHRDGQVQTYSADESIPCEGVAEGLTVALADIFSER